MNCYICKIGLLPEEPTPPLYNREGINLCKHCLDVTNSRAAKMEKHNIYEKAT